MNSKDGDVSPIEEEGIEEAERDVSRRSFLKYVGLGAGAASVGGLSARPLLAGEKAVSEREFVGVLVDTTRCIGCRRCEVACAKEHGLPVPDPTDRSVFEEERGPTVDQWTAVSRYETDRGEVYVKKQCMHCNQPACAAACLVKAMEKKVEGPVVWNTNCMGCRICMVSCPFDIPKFEYEKAAPKIQKCNLCWERLAEGRQPACVETCPQEALVFGTRRQILEEARKRIYRGSTKYVPHIFGEYEVGGTAYLYLSSVPFEQLGFRTDLGRKSYPKFSTGFLYAVPVILALWPAFLMGIRVLTLRNHRRRVTGEGEA